MSAHVPTAPTTVSLDVPVERGRLCLGTWRAIYLWEHRTAAPQRTVAVHVVGE